MEKILNTNIDHYQVDAIFIDNVSTYTGLSGCAKVITLSFSNDSEESLIDSIISDIDTYYASSLRKQKHIKMYPAIRACWQSLADVFAFENSDLGIIADGKIREVSDKFKPFLDYLSMNDTTTALIEIDNIIRDDKYCTDIRLNSMRDSLANFIATFE